MDLLKLNEMQTYYDEKNNDKLQLWFGMHEFTFKNIHVSLNGVPLLKNEKKWRDSFS